MNTMHAGRAGAMRWCAGFALLLGCGSDPNGDPTTDAANQDLKHADFGHPPPTARPSPFPGHHFGHGRGHGHGAGPGVPGSGGGSSSSGGTNAGGMSNGSGGTYGSAGSGFGGHGGSVPAVCGDGTVVYPESCDDGNTTSGDGCNASCQVEPNYVCNWGEACRLVVCGDGNQDGTVNADGTYVYEQCDDGNTTSGDGCSSACVPEVGFICGYPGESCKHVVCGDGSQDAYVVGFETNSGSGGAAGSSSTGSAGSGMAGGGSAVPSPVYAYEQCDDGNTASGDGCSSTCGIEAGYICTTPGEACRVPRCGDGFVDFIPGTGGATGAGGMTGSGGSGYAGGPSWGSVEECDDGNITSGDGCTATCAIEAGYSCQEPGVPCKLAVCGDGVVDWPAETCDDGNHNAGDGCAPNCQYETGSGGFGGMFGSGGAPGTGGTSIWAGGMGGFGNAPSGSAGH